jgi:hypothetical protein
VWHPVGDLPSAVYWRRRLLVLLVLVAILAGAGSLGYAVVTGRIAGGEADAAAATSSTRVVPTPALARVVPSLTAVRTPTPPQTAEHSRPTTTPAPVVPVPSSGGPCTDQMITLAVRAPDAVAVGSMPTLELVVQNTSRVPCVRPLDKALQEIVLLDGSGARLWGSNDCFPEAGQDTRTLAPGVTTSFPLVWSGRTSEPTCTAARGTPAPGAYVLRGRLDTKASPDTPITLR